MTGFLEKFAFTDQWNRLVSLHHEKNQLDLRKLIVLPTVTLIKGNQHGKVTGQSTQCALCSYREKKIQSFDDGPPNYLKIY